MINRWRNLLISLSLLAGISSAQSVTTITPIPVDPWEVLGPYGLSPSIAGDYGLYLMGRRENEDPQDTALWRFDGDSLERIPLPAAPEGNKANEKPCGGCFPADYWNLSGTDNDLYISNFFGPGGGPFTLRWWWSDGFSARRLSSHPALDAGGSIRRMGGINYLLTDNDLWTINGAEDRINHLVTLPGQEYFLDLEFRQGALILWSVTREEPDRIWRLKQWRIHDNALQQRLDIPFDQNPTQPLWAGDRWYLWTFDGKLWQILNGLASPVPGLAEVQNLTAIGDSVYLTATTPALGREPYRVSGAEVVLLGDLSPGPYSSYVYYFLACGDWVCFYGPDAEGTPTWWSTDGSDTRPLLSNVEIAYFGATNYNGAFYLTAIPEGGNLTLYRSFDGKNAETVLETCGPQGWISLRWVFAGSLFLDRQGCEDNVELLRLTDPITPLVNLSLNIHIDPAAALTPGFIVNGNGGRYALLGESQYQSGEPLPDPILTLRNLETGEILQHNDQWRELPRVDALLNGVRAPGSDNDAALVLDLPPGSYVAELRDRQNRGGQALLSIQQMDGMRELENISANTRVSAEGVIPGFVVQGDGGRFVVFGEAQYQTGEPLADPIITVRDLATGIVLDSNDDWQDHPTADEVVREVRAPAGERDAALALDLPLGAYVVELRDAGGGEGQALLSIQRIPGS